jgi:chromate reductase
VDKAAATGIPEKAEEFKKLIESADGIIISLAEHNGSYSAAFKNIMDWISRMPSKLWGEKKMLLLSTSPGGRGGQNVLNTAAGGYPYMGAEVITTFAMPSYHANFSEAEGITDAGLRTEFEKALSLFTTALD